MRKSFKDYLITSTLIVLCAWSAWNFMMRGGSSVVPDAPPDISARAHEVLGSTLNPDNLNGQTKPIILFVTSWCGVCRSLEKKLKAEKLQFTVVDIEKDKNAEAFYLSLMGPKRGPIPVTLVGSQVFIGDQSRAIIATSRSS